MSIQPYTFLFMKSLWAILGILAAEMFGYFHRGTSNTCLLRMQKVIYMMNHQTCINAQNIINYTIICIFDLRNEIKPSQSGSTILPIDRNCVQIGQAGIVQWFHASRIRHRPLLQTCMLCNTTA